MNRGEIFDKAEKGEIFETAQFVDDEGNGVITLVAESDSGGAVSPCFSAWGPTITGVLVRASAISVSGFAPTATSAITLTDEFGGSWSWSVITAGSSDFIASGDSPWLHGRFKVSIDTMGAASKRWKITLFYRKEALVYAV